MKKYTTHDLHTRPSMDGVSSGTNLTDEDRGSQLDLKEKTFARLSFFLTKALNSGAVSEEGFRLMKVDFNKKQDAGGSDVVSFVLTDGLRKVSFSLKRAGARGQFLNAWWNPNKFLSGGQNVFPAVTGGITTLGVEWQYLPHLLVEYPFLLLVGYLDTVFGEAWPARKEVKKMLDGHEVYWQRMDFTLYTNELERPDLILGALSVSARSRIFCGLLDRERGAKATELSLESLIGVVAVDDGGVSPGYTYLRLNKTVESKGNGRRPTALSICLYLKDQEVKATKNTNNLVALKKNPGLVENRLRQEFSFYSASMLKLASVRKVLFGEDRAVGNIRTAKALMEIFPDTETFRSKINQLLLVTVKEMGLDFLLVPQNPVGLAERVYEATGDEVLRELLVWWRERGMEPLPAPRKAHESGRFAGIPRSRLEDAYRTIAREFLDVQVFSFAVCQTVYSNMVRACLNEDQFLELLEVEADASRTRRAAELMTLAQTKFRSLRKSLKSTIGLRPLESNLNPLNQLS